MKALRLAVLADGAEPANIIHSGIAYVRMERMTSSVGLFDN